MMTGAEVYDEINALQISAKDGKFVGYGVEHMWTHKSPLMMLPYYKDLLPHNIDVMHTEKNVAEALWATVMDIPDKTKDNVKARVDLATICDRPKLHMQPRSGKKWTRPKADYRLKQEEKREVLEWTRVVCSSTLPTATLREFNFSNKTSLLRMSDIVSFICDGMPSCH